MPRWKGGIAMDDRMERELIQHAVDVTLSGVQGNPYRVQRVLAAARRPEEKKTVKRKLSVSLVLVIVLILASVTALAVGLTNYISGFRALENEYGSYDHWPATAQVKLVDLMLENGVLTAEDVPGWQQLSGPDKEAAAEKALNRYTEGMVFVDTESIMVRMWGYFDQWSEEQRALYTELNVQYGDQGRDWPYYMVPSGTDLNREQAVEKAKDHLVNVFDADRQFLDTLPVTAYFAASSYNNEGLPADEPYWEIDLGEERGTRHSVAMTRTGELLSLYAPGTSVTRPVDLSGDIMAGVKPADLNASPISEERALISARADLTEIGPYSVSGEEAELLTGEAMFVYSHRYMQGSEPVWLVNWSMDGELKYRVMMAPDGHCIERYALNGWPLYEPDTGVAQPVDLPGDVVTDPAPVDLSGDIMAGVKPADISESAITEEQAILWGRGDLTEIGADAIPVEEAELLTGEAMFVYSDRYMQGSEPVWLVNWYMDGELLYRTMDTADGHYIERYAVDGRFD